MSILLLESIHSDAQALLEEHFAIRSAGPDASVPDSIDPNSIQAIVTRGRGQITQQVIQACANLKVIARCGAGLDNLDLQAAAQADIPVVYAPGKTSFAVAEHTILLMLALARQLLMLTREVSKGNWAVRSGYEGMELRGKSLGLIGLGAIGRTVATLGQAFGMHVQYWSRSPKPVAYPYLALEDILRQSDFVSLHTALTPETRHFISSKQLELLKPHAYLVNTARGALVEETALIEALENEQLAGYATDLLETDPPESNHPFLSHPKILVTPHSAVLTDHTYRDICVSTARNVSAVLRGKAPEQNAIYS